MIVSKPHNNDFAAYNSVDNIANNSNVASYNFISSFKLFFFLYRTLDQRNQFLSIPFWYLDLNANSAREKKEYSVTKQHGNTLCLQILA